MDLLFFKQELKSFLDSEDRLIKYPSKNRPKLISLFYLATKFEAGKEYTEKEINTILDMHHTFNDKCMLRRDLFDRHFLGRTQNGSKYWLEEVQPTLRDLGLVE